MRGHLWSSLLGLGDIGALFEMIIGYTIIFAGIILLAAGWRQVFRAQKRGSLVTDGLYKHVRHPQYTGIFIAVLGQLVHWPTILTLFLAPLILFLYYRLSIKEERKMLKQFGAEYAIYATRTPRFIPRISAWRQMFQETKEPVKESRRGSESPATVR